MKLSLLALPALLLAASTAAAQPAYTEPGAAPLAPAPEPEKKNSINVSPFGLFVGNLYVTYERKLTPKHGLIVDAGFGRASHDGVEESHGALGVGWRYHWKGRPNGGFLGVMLHQEYGSGNVTITENGNTRSYDMTVASTELTGNLGYRWMLTDAVNVTFRLGLGWGKHVATAKMDTAEAKEAEDDMNDLLSFFPIGVDGELSLGYNF